MNNENKKRSGADATKKNPGFVIAILSLAIVMVVLVLLAVLIQPIMTPKAKIEATAISMTKTVAAKTGAYIDPELLIEPLPVENVSGIAILGGLMGLIILGIVLREYLIWRKRKED